MGKHLKINILSKKTAHYNNEPFYQLKQNQNINFLNLIV